MAEVNVFKRLAGLLGRNPSPNSIPALDLVRLRSKAEFHQYYEDRGSEVHAASLAECDLFTEVKPFTVEGYCYVCNKTVTFDVLFSLTREMHGRTMPVFREDVVCPSCGLRNRQRAAVHMVEAEANLKAPDALYLTEQASLLYKAMHTRHKATIGSEHLGNTVALGQKNPQGIRNEDLTRTTFCDAQFSHLMSFEVLEHIPNYFDAVREIARILKPGGKLVMTVPFNPYLQEHSVRAEVRADGSIEHLLEPEYHIDPLNPAGCLCFRHFGWAMLDDLRSAGFSDAYVVRYGSRDFCYLGPDPMMFIATR